MTVFSPFCSWATFTLRRDVSIMSVYVRGGICLQSWCVFPRLLSANPRWSRSILKCAAVNKPFLESEWVKTPASGGGIYLSAWPRSLLWYSTPAQQIDSPQSRSALPPPQTALIGANKSTLCTTPKLIQVSHLNSTGGGRHLLISANLYIHPHLRAAAAAPPSGLPSFYVLRCGWHFRHDKDKSTSCLLLFRAVLWPSFMISARTANLMLMVLM